MIAVIRGPLIRPRYRDHEKEGSYPDMLGCAAMQEEDVAAAVKREPGPAAERQGRPQAEPSRLPGPDGLGGQRFAPPKTPRGRGDRVPWLIALAVFAAYTTISVFRYLRLAPTSWDLGIFTEYVRQYAHLKTPIVDIRAAGFNLLGDHFQPIVGLIAPFFRIFPSPVTLLVAQSLLTAVSVVPVSRAAAEKLGATAGRAIGAAYGFSWGLQQMIDFDFHEIAFAVPLLAFSLSALVRGRTRAAIAWALPLVFVKEDQGFTVAAIGILVIFLTSRPLGGLLLTVWGMAWSILAIGYIVPHFNPIHKYPYWDKGGVIGPSGGGHFSASGLIAQLGTASPTKLQTTIIILLPTAFIALRSPLVTAALPSLALRFASTNSYYWGTLWHYNATVMPIVFVAAIDAIARTRAQAPARGADASRPPGPPRGEAGATDRAAGAGSPLAGTVSRMAARTRPLMAALERHGAAAMVAIAVAMAFQYPLSSLWNSQTYAVDSHVAAANAAMARVQDGATVETTLGLLAPLAARTDTFWIGNGGNPAPQYVVYDMIHSDYSPPPANLVTFVEQRHPGARYTQIYSADDVIVLRRVSG